MFKVRFNEKTTSVAVHVEKERKQTVGLLFRREDSLINSASTKENNTKYRLRCKEEEMSWNEGENVKKTEKAEQKMTDNKTI